MDIDDLRKKLNELTINYFESMKDGDEYFPTNAIYEMIGVLEERKKVLLDFIEYDCHYQQDKEQVT